MVHSFDDVWVQYFALEDIQKYCLISYYCGMFMFCILSSGETPNESRYKSAGDRYRSRIPAHEELYCLFLDHCIDLCYHHHLHGGDDGDEPQ